MTIEPGVCYVCFGPKSEHTDDEIRLGCNRPPPIAVLELGEAVRSRFFSKAGYIGVFVDGVCVNESPTTDEDVAF